MPHGRHFADYEPVTRSRRAPDWEGDPTAISDWPSHEDRPAASATVESEVAELPPRRAPRAQRAKKENWILKRGHALSYAGLFLFTAVLYFRPYELSPALSVFSSMAFVIALCTLALFFPSQLALEGNLTSRPREVNLVLLLCLTALLSIPLAISPGEAWTTFSEMFAKVVLMFIVMVNVIRTEWRLKGMFFLALAVSFVLGALALNDYRVGNLTVEGYRVSGGIGGMFGNPNDMALHLATIVPIAVAMLLSTRGPFKKMFYITCTVLMVGGIVVTFSRSGFLGLLGAVTVMGWKIGRRHRFAVMIAMLIFTVAFLALAPGGYGERVASILSHDLDPVHSASTRQALLMRSIFIAFAHPLFGIGMGNFHIVSIHEAVTHNAFTQVASEMGMIALALYVMFMITPLKGLRQIERECFHIRANARFYYLAVGLQASLVAYMVSSFFASVAYYWYIYYLVGYAVCLRRIYAAGPGGAEERARSARDREQQHDLSRGAEEDRAPVFPLDEEGEARAIRA